MPVPILQDGTVEEAVLTAAWSMGTGASAHAKNEVEADKVFTQANGNRRIKGHDGELIDVIAVYDEVQCHGKELKAFWTVETIEEVLARYDDDHDGKLTFQQFLAALNDLERTNVKVRKERNKAGARLQTADDEITASVMRACDSDGEGALDRSDFMQALVLRRKIAKDRDRIQQKQESCACVVA